MRKALLVLALAGGAVAAQASAGTASTLRGVVISSLPTQGELVIASASGATTTLRSPSLPATGTVIKTSAFALSDGTSAARRRRARMTAVAVGARGVLPRAARRR